MPPQKFADDKPQINTGEEFVQRPHTKEIVVADARSGIPQMQAYSPPTLNISLDLSDALFKKYIAPHVQPLKEGATQKEISATLSKLYDLIKLAEYGGLLGIEYQDSANRIPKTPDQALTPEKDKKLRADCEESAMLFFSSAKKLNAPIEEIAFVDITLQTKGKLDSYETERLHMAVIYVGSQFYLFDATHGMSGPIDSLNFAGINKFYAGKEFTRAGVTTTILGIAEEPKILTGEGGAYAVHYMELGGYYNNSKQYDMAYAAYQKAYESESTEECKHFLVKACLNSGGAAYNQQRYAEAEFYFRKALEHDQTSSDVKHDLVMTLAMQKNSEALKLCDEFIKTDVTFYKVKALAAIKIGDKSAELEAMNAWVGATKSAEAFEEATKSLLRHKRYNDAISLCKEWGKTDPTAQKPYWGQAHALFLIGQDESNAASAIAYFEQVIDAGRMGLSLGIKKDNATSQDLTELMAKAQRNIDKLKKSH